MTRETLIKAFVDNRGRKYTIYTDICYGRGINGVAYRDYHSWTSEGQLIYVIDFAEDCIVLVNQKDTVIYLPYERVVEISFYGALQPDWYANKPDDCKTY